MLNTIFYTIFLICFIYCVFSVLYLFIFSFAGRFFYRGNARGVISSPEATIAVLVPAYKEDGIILSTAKSLLMLDYPPEKYDVYIIADSFQPSTLEQLRALNLTVIEVSFEKSTKTKALNVAFGKITRQYDLALISDADNILARDFLKKINSSFAAGHRALQGRRVAKNLDSSFAILDACSEAINNHIFRKGPNAAGLSSSVIGSGMAFDFNLVKQTLSEIDAVGGFDKILQLKIVGQGHQIRYLDDALVFDEKVDSPDAFRQQRKRWVSSQFIYLKQFLAPAFRQLLKGNLSYFNLAIVSNLVLPRAFLLVVTPLLVAGGFFIGVAWGIAAAVLLLLYILTLGMALPRQLVNKDLLKAALRLPGAIGMMVLMLFNMKKANKTFIHTVHTKTEVSNAMFSEKTK